MTITWDRIKDLLTILILPLIIWGVRLEVSNAVQEEKIAELKNKVSSSEETVKKIESAVQSNSIELAKLGSKIEGLDEKVDDIHKLLIKEK
tara:strand:- start:69 stop:341 length:273 start_codon:yes stop_codon:yes gene_type:complete